MVRHKLGREKDLGRGRGAEYLQSKQKQKKTNGRSVSFSKHDCVSLNIAGNTDLCICVHLYMKEEEDKNEIPFLFSPKSEKPHANHTEQQTTAVQAMEKFIVSAS